MRGDRVKKLGRVVVMICLGTAVPAAGEIVDADEMQRIDATKDPIVLAKFPNGSIDVDGVLREPAWQQVPAFDNMRVTDPDILAHPRYRTATHLLYTDRGLYVGIACEQPRETLIARLSSRDETVNRDGISFALDTTGTGTYGYWFSVNLGGTLADGNVLPERQFTREWDGPWRGMAAYSDDGFAVEMFLPWSMMAMPDTHGDKRRMAFYVSRKVAHVNERWTWPTLPFTQPQFLSILQPIEVSDVHPRPQFALFPFATTTRDNIQHDRDYRVGMDLFWRPSTNLQLTATLNPDFGTVESDDVVINLSAFETFFPEKRLFFLEGSEIFVTSPRSNVYSGSSSSAQAARSRVSYSVSEPTALVNTRRIGGPAPTPQIPDGITVTGVELGKPTELTGAAKLTGQHGQLRYGVLAAREEDSVFEGHDATGARHLLRQAGRDFGALRLLYESSGKGRRGIGWIATRVAHPDRDALVQGVDLHYLNGTGTFNADGQLIVSDVDGVVGRGTFWDVTYTKTRGLTHRLSVDWFDDKLDVNEFGYIRRNDSIYLRYYYNYSTAELDYLRDRSNAWAVSQEYNGDGRVVRSKINWRARWTFPNRVQIYTNFEYDPARWDDRNTYGNGEYRVHDRWLGEVSFGTNSSRKLSFSAAIGARQEQLSDWTLTAASGITLAPNDRFSMDLDVNYKRRHGWLLYSGGRNLTTYQGIDWQPSLAADLFLTAKQQLRLTLQWAGIRASGEHRYQVPPGDGRLQRVADARDQRFTISRLTAQLRYRWEIAPLSDLFVVFTRGSNLPSRAGEPFDELFHDALTDPLIDLFVIKLRYRIAR